LHTEPRKKQHTKRLTDQFELSNMSRRRVTKHMPGSKKKAVDINDFTVYVRSSPRTLSRAVLLVAGLRTILEN